MKKTILVILLVIAENLALLQLARFMFATESFNKLHLDQIGLEQACDSIQLGTTFDVVLRNLARYKPELIFNADGTRMIFAPDSMEATGNALIFDKADKLTARRCGREWLPEEDRSRNP